MLGQNFWRLIVAGGLMFGAMVLLHGGAVRGAETDRQRAARQHWESVVVWFGDEDTGEWSLRIRDQDVHERGWFEYLELWQFDLKEERWVQLKVDKFAKAIVLPKQKGTDQPEGNQTLVELKEIEPKTAGLWFAKWKVDDVPCSTYMKVGGARPKDNLAEKKEIPGMLRTVVPIDLDNSVWMYIPDPRVYCIAGGPGKPEKK